MSYAAKRRIIAGFTRLATEHAKKHVSYTQITLSILCVYQRNGRIQRTNRSEHSVVARKVTCIFSNLLELSFFGGCFNQTTRQTFV